MERGAHGMKETIGVKAFRLLGDGKLQTGEIGRSTTTVFEEGGVYEVDNDNDAELCVNGFHFYAEGNGCFGVDLFGPKTVFHEVVAHGTIVSDTEKCACRRITVGKRIEMGLDGHRNSGDSNSGDNNSGDNNSGSWNSGDRNSGYWNSGYRNSGHRNSGSRNSGYKNSGHRNSGDSNSGDNNSGDNNSGRWNSCNNESGFLNTTGPKSIRVFNKLCKKDKWDNCEKPNFLCFDLDTNLTYKENWQKSWDNTTGEDRKLVELLPNFSWKVFTELTGIKKGE